MKIFREILSPLIAVLAAFVVGGIVILLIGDNPLEAYRLLLANSFGSAKDVGYTLFYATPLIFTGLAVAVAFRCGLLNIGAEGQLYVASFATAWVGIKFGGAVVDVFGKQEDWSWVSLPAVLLVPLCILTAMVGWRNLGRDSGDFESEIRLARSHQHDYAEFYRHRAGQLSHTVLLQNRGRPDSANRRRSAKPRTFRSSINFCRLCPKDVPLSVAFMHRDSDVRSRLCFFLENKMGL